MRGKERKESSGFSLFPLDTDIINRLGNSLKTGVIDSELAELLFKHGRVADNDVVLSFAGALGGEFRNLDLGEIFTMGSMFTYGVIAHSAHKLGLEVPIVNGDDIDVANKVLLRDVPTEQPSALSREAQMQVTKHFTDILTKPEEGLAKALSAIVTSRLQGPMAADRLQLRQSTAHYGAAVVYFPMVEAHKRMSIKYN